MTKVILRIIGLELRSKNNRNHKIKKEEKTQLQMETQHHKVIQLQMEIPPTIQA